MIEIAIGTLAAMAEQFWIEWPKKRVKCQACRLGWYCLFFTMAIYGYMISWNIGRQSGFDLFICWIASWGVSIIIHRFVST